jgi:threonylcarbamoyladenosine tRNA methylthiotransferase MtaB
MSKKVNFHTLGCRLNQAESAIISSSLKEKGYTIVKEDDTADIAIINTCTVTEQADAKCRQVVRKNIRKNPQTKIAVIGCYAQMDVPAIKKIEGVDLIIGNEYKLQIADIIETIEKGNEPQVIHSKKISNNEFTIDSIASPDSLTRANLKIQDGCNFVCSFCIIATARGPARSRKFEDIILEAKKLVQMGYQEIVLTGVNIGTYQQNNKSFIDLLTALEQIENLNRLRISSIEPTTVTKELIDFMANSKIICPYLHIPLQSGDDKILQEMRRKHSSKEFADIINYAHQKIKNVGIGTDVMVGFPGEDEESFKLTKKFLADIPLSYFHVFSYSDRKGTTSYNLKPKVDFHEKKKRSKILNDISSREKRTFLTKFKNTQMDVLFEEERNGYWEGFTGNYMRVRVANKGNLKNKICSVTLRNVEGEKLIGELC